MTLCGILIVRPRVVVLGGGDGAVGAAATLLSAPTKPRLLVFCTGLREAARRLVLAVS